VPGDDYSRAELAELRRKVNKRVAKLAKELEERRRLEATVASARQGSQGNLEDRFPAMRGRRRGGTPGA
jgi:chorismate mutase